MRFAQLALIAILTIFASFGTASAAPAAQTDQRCFPETSYCISGRIREFWEQNGDLPVFGYPIGPQQEERIEGKHFQVQWFERNRLELHPENQRPYDVLLGRLGIIGINPAALPHSSEMPPADSGCHLFIETSAMVCSNMWAFWSSHGLEFDRRAGKSYEESLALFGYPLGDAVTTSKCTYVAELGYSLCQTVQYFERARFEYHPENAGTQYAILLGLLGSEQYVP